MSNSRIPTALDKFSNYVRTAINYLLAIPTGGTVANGERLGLTTGTGSEMAELQTKRDQWSNSSNNGLWDKHSDPNTKNRVTRNNVVAFVKDFGIFFQPLLNRMATSTNIILADYTALNIAIPDADPGEPLTKITEGVMFSAKSNGGASFNMKCRTGIDGSRASLPEGADSVQASFVFSDSQTEFPELNLKYPQVTSTKASFVLDVGNENEGKWMKIRMRWYNSKHPEIASDWSAPQTIIVG